MALTVKWSDRYWQRMLTLQGHGSVSESKQLLASQIARANFSSADIKGQMLLVPIVFRKYVAQLKYYS